MFFRFAVAVLAVSLLAFVQGGCQEGDPLQGENGTGDGEVMKRVGASGSRTVWLHAGESRTFTFEEEAGNYWFGVQYSNDNGDETRLETVELILDKESLGSFSPQNTRPEGAEPGEGWDDFFLSLPFGPVSLDSKEHTLNITVSGGDGYGVEIDKIILERVDQEK